jgi:hypothetical protein
MKLTNLSVLIASFAWFTQACWQVHTNLITDPFTNDQQYIQLYFMGAEEIELCRGLAGTPFVSDNEDHFSLTCGDYYIEVWNNGRQGFLESMALPLDFLFFHQRR